MAKIIEHNFGKKKGWAGRDRLAGSFACFMDEMDEKKFLLGEMVMQARLFLEREGMAPGDFILSETYLREFWAMRMEEEGAYAEIVYIRYREGQITAVCQFASQKTDDFEISYQIYSMDPRGGNKRWKVYNFQSGEWLEDEEDCFDMNLLLRDISRFPVEES